MRHPVISKESVRKLAAVTDAAIHDMDNNGVLPDEALAKAASEVGLPVGQVPLVVRGFNNAMSARQRLSSDNPWEKAASFTPATEEGVRSKLAEVVPNKKEECSTSKSCDDYESPPPKVKVVRDNQHTAVKLAKFLGIEEGKKEVKQEKKASEEKKKYEYSEAHALMEVSKHLNKFAREMQSCSSSTYSAVKQAAVNVFGEDVSLVLSFIEERHPALKKAASSEPDPAVGNDTPFLDYLERAIYVLNNTEVKEAFNNAVGGSIMKNPFISGPLAKSDTKPGLYNSMVDFGRRKNEMFGDLRRKAIDANYHSILNSEETKLPFELDRIEEQQSVNDLLADNRVKGTDPAKVIDMYKTLRGLAPTVMRNPSVAADMIHRQIQTGPLSYFDLGQLAQMEKNVAEAARARASGA